MSTHKKISSYQVSILGALGCIACVGVQAATIAPDLAAELAVRAPGDEVAVILTLSNRVDRRQFKLTDRSEHNTRLVKALKEKSAATQGIHRTFLLNKGARRLRELWAINGIAVKARASVIRQLSSRPGIESIRLDSILAAPVATLGTAAPPEWNLSAVGAPDMWALGHSGAGVVVANMDTGVDAEHPDLALQWRGGSNSWYDPHGEHAVPHDSNGHGTQTMSIMVGGSAGGSAIGMAPDARWIAVKLYNDAGLTSYSTIHLAFQWLLDPDGDINTPDAPDVVNASWGLVGSAGKCLTEFSADIDMLKAAGIAVAFPAGNDGPAPLTSVSPANNPSAFSTGAVDATLAVASFSSRGQSACDGSVFPKLVTPGVNINTADLSFGGLPLYAVVSGTSYAAPHAAGAMALLAGAFPGAGIAQIEAALTQSAQDLGVAGEDNSYGYGLANVQAAYQVLLAAGNGSPVAQDNAYSMIQGGTLNVAALGVLADDSDPDAGDTLTAVNFSAASNGALTGNADGSFAYTPAGAFTGIASFNYQAQDSSGAANDTSALATVSITVNANQAPLALNNTFNAPMRRTAQPYVAQTLAILANDSDPDTAIDPGNLINPASVTITAAPNKGGVVVVNANGTLSYRPRLNFRGSEVFWYRVSDSRAAISNAAMVRVNVR